MKAIKKKRILLSQDSYFSSKSLKSRKATMNKQHTNPMHRFENYTGKLKNYELIFSDTDTIERTDDYFSSQQYQQSVRNHLTRSAEELLEDQHIDCNESQVSDPECFPSLNSSRYLNRNMPDTNDILSPVKHVRMKIRSLSVDNLIRLSQNGVGNSNNHKKDNITSTDVLNSSFTQNKSQSKLLNLSSNNNNMDIIFTNVSSSDLNLILRNRVNCNENKHIDEDTNTQLSALADYDIDIFSGQRVSIKRKSESTKHRYFGSSSLTDVVQPIAIDNTVKKVKQRNLISKHNENVNSYNTTLITNSKSANYQETQGQPLHGSKNFNIDSNIELSAGNLNLRTRKINKVQHSLGIYSQESYFKNKKCKIENSRILKAGSNGSRKVYRQTVSEHFCELNRNLSSVSSKENSRNINCLRSRLSSTEFYQNSPGYDEQYYESMFQNGCNLLPLQQAKAISRNLLPEFEELDHVLRKDIIEEPLCGDELNGLLNCSVSDYFECENNSELNISTLINEAAKADGHYKTHSAATNILSDSFRQDDSFSLIQSFSSDIVSPVGGKTYEKFKLSSRNEPESSVNYRTKALLSPNYLVNKQVGSCIDRKKLSRNKIESRDDSFVFELPDPTESSTALTEFVEDADTYLIPNENILNDLIAEINETLETSRFPLPIKEYTISNDLDSASVPLAKAHHTDIVNLNNSKNDVKFELSSDNESECKSKALLSPNSLVNTQAGSCIGSKKLPLSKIERRDDFVFELPDIAESSTVLTETSIGNEEFVDPAEVENINEILSDRIAEINKPLEMSRFPIPINATDLAPVASMLTHCTDMVNLDNNKSDMNFKLSSENQPEAFVNCRTKALLPYSLFNTQADCCMNSNVMSLEQTKYIDDSFVFELPDLTESAIALTKTFIETNEFVDEADVCSIDATLNTNINLLNNLTTELNGSPETSIFPVPIKDHTVANNLDFKISNCYPLSSQTDFRATNPATNNSITENQTTADQYTWNSAVDTLISDLENSEELETMSIENSFMDFNFDESELMLPVNEIDASFPLTINESKNTNSSFYCSNPKFELRNKPIPFVPEKSFDLTESHITSFNIGNEISEIEKLVAANNRESQLVRVLNDIGFDIPGNQDTVIQSLPEAFSQPISDRDRDVEALADTDMRRNIKNRIEHIFLDVIKKLIQRRPLYFTVRNQDRFDNCIYEDGCLKIKPIGEARNKIIKKKSHFYGVVLYLLAKCYRLLQRPTTCTKREAYYLIKDHVLNQDQIYRAMNAISSMLDVEPWHLPILSTSKGVVFGDLTLEVDEQILRCNVPGGFLIPFDVTKIKRFRSDAVKILIIEKDAIFKMLLEEDLLTKFKENCLLVTGKGYPDVNTRLFVRRLGEFLKIPIFILVDGDPHGIEIMLTYRFGSLALSHVSDKLAIPTLKWLGILPSEILPLNITHRRLTKREISLTKKMLQRPYIDYNLWLKNELETLLENNFKADIEGVIKSNFYLTDFYLTNKLNTSDYF